MAHGQGLEKNKKRIMRWDPHMRLRPSTDPRTTFTTLMRCLAPQKPMREEGFEPSNPLKGQDLKSCAFGQALLPPQNGQGMECI